MPILPLLGVAIGLLLFSKKALGGEEKVSGEINNSFDVLFKKYASIYGLDWKLLKRISWIESRIGTYKSVKRGIENPRDIAGSVSSDGKSWGIMQTTVETSRDYDPTITPEKLNNPETSIKIGAQHLAFLKKRYFSNERDLVMSYNHGQGNQLRFIEKEKARTLGLNEFVAGRDYYQKYLTAKGLIP